MNGVCFVEANDPDVAVPRIVELVKSHIPRRLGLDPIRDIQVLADQSMSPLRQLTGPLSMLIRGAGGYRGRARGCGTVVCICIGKEQG